VVFVLTLLLQKAGLGEFPEVDYAVGRQHQRPLAVGYGQTEVEQTLTIGIVLPEALDCAPGSEDPGLVGLEAVAPASAEAGQDAEENKPASKGIAVICRATHSEPFWDANEVLCMSIDILK
jgi:hypothetical protein